MTETEQELRNATVDKEIIEIKTELKWHRYLLIAILAATLAGVRIFDPVLIPHP